METEKKLNFAANLKASNIAVSIVTLKEYSKQILLLLNLINEEIDDNNKVAKSNLTSSIETLKKTQESSENVLEEYLRFGERYYFLLNDVDKDNENNKRDDMVRFLKQIAIYYLDIAKILKDERVNKLSFSIADKLIQNDNQ